MDHQLTCNQGFVRLGDLYKLDTKKVALDQLRLARVFGKGTLDTDITNALAAHGRLTAQLIGAGKYGSLLASIWLDGRPFAVVQERSNEEYDVWHHVWLTDKALYTQAATHLEQVIWEVEGPAAPDEHREFVDAAAELPVEVIFNVNDQNLGKRYGVKMPQKPKAGEKLYKYLGHRLLRDQPKDVCLVISRVPAPPELLRRDNCYLRLSRRLLASERTWKSLPDYRHEFLYHHLDAPPVDFKQAIAF